MPLPERKKPKDVNPDNGEVSSVEDYRGHVAECATRLVELHRQGRPWNEWKADVHNILLFGLNGDCYEKPNPFRHHRQFTVDALLESRRFDPATKPPVDRTIYILRIRSLQRREICALSPPP